MADLANTAQQQQIREQGWLGKTISLPFRFIGVMLLSLFLSVIFEWIGLYFFWSDQGWHHARDMMFLELDWISEDFTNSFIIEEPGLTASQLIEAAYKTGFEDTGIVEFFHGQSEAYHRESLRGDGSFDQAIGSAMVLIEDYALAAVFSVLTFLVRLIVLTLTTPLFLMAIAVGLVDGSGQTGHPPVRRRARVWFRPSQSPSNHKALSRSTVADLPLDASQHKPPSDSFALRRPTRPSCERHGWQLQEVPVIGVAARNITRSRAIHDPI